MRPSMSSCSPMAQGKSSATRSNAPTPTSLSSSSTSKTVENYGRALLILLKQAKRIRNYGTVSLKWSATDDSGRRTSSRLCRRLQSRLWTCSTTWRKGQKEHWVNRTKQQNSTQRAMSRRRSSLRAITNKRKHNPKVRKRTWRSPL